MLQQVHENPPESVKFACCRGNALKQLKQRLQRDLARSQRQGRHKEYRLIYTDLDDLGDMLEGVE